MAAEYDMYVKRCSASGIPTYYGVNFNGGGGNNTYTQVNGQDYITGSGQSPNCPDASSMSALPNKVIYGNGFVNYTNSLSAGLGYKKYDLQRITAFAKQYRWLMLMQLRNAGVPVLDKNNIFEIAAKYANSHAGLASPSDSIISKVSTLGPKPKSLGTDIFGGALSVIDGIITAASNAGVEKWIQDFAKAFQTYMHNDFGEIEKTLNGTRENPGAWGGWGPRGALDMFIQFKNTSWADLKRDITAYCAEHGNKPIPSVVNQLWAEQDKLEQNLRNLVANSGGGNNSGGGANTGGDTTGGYSPGSFMKYLPAIVIALVAVVVLVGLYKMFSKKK